MTQPLSPDTAELLALHEWMREPDWAENFSLEDMANWINRRPTHTTERLTAPAQQPASPVTLSAAYGIVEKAGAIYENHRGDDAWVVMEAAYVELITEALAAPAQQPPSHETAVWDFATAILHGDDQHRAWLLEAALTFAAGKPLPAVRGSGVAQRAGDTPIREALVKLETAVTEYWKTERTPTDAIGVCIAQADARKALALPSTDGESPVMGAAKRAAKVVEGWSDSKRDYADRVTSPLCSCKASARDGQHMAWCPAVTRPDGGP